MTIDYKNIIQNSIGKTVHNIVRVQTFFNDEEDADGFGDLELTFTDNTNLTLLGVGNADSIAVSNCKITTPKTYNVTENDIVSWKRIGMNDAKYWKSIIGLTLRFVEVKKSSDSFSVRESLTACVLNFDSNFITFYETMSDSTKFFVNKPLPENYRNRIAETIK